MLHDEGGRNSEFDICRALLGDWRGSGHSEIKK